MKTKPICRWLSRALPAASLLANAALHSAAHAQVPANKSAAPLFLSAPLVQNAPIQAVNSSPTELTTTPTLYVVTYSHLDTEWCWTYRNSILEYIPNTLSENFALFEKYPHYIFNWTGGNRYRFIKDYYPAEYARLKHYVAAGRWIPTGSAWDENDAIVPSPESIIRSILYTNRWFQKEFGKTSNQYMMPDTFGFPASLPTVLTHCGLTGFSTKKLTYGAGAAVGVPFNVGKWIGPDNTFVVAALNPGDYRTRVTEDLSQSEKWRTRLNENGKATGVFADYMYHGNGDLGGSPGAESANWLEKSVGGTGPIKVHAGGADDLFRDLTGDQTKNLPTYKGDLLLIQHSAGSINSGAAMKKWNHRNERLADAAERASIAAHIVAQTPYPTERLTDAWLRFLGGQMHDILPGTSIPPAYDLAWNDQIIALNQFADVDTHAVSQIAAQLDTRVQGVPLVVYNPLSIARDDVVSADVIFPHTAPARVRVVGPDGSDVPAQMQSRSGNRATILFSARSVPSVSVSVFDVRPASTVAQTQATSPLRVRLGELENARYRVRLGKNGDVSSIFDKRAKRELLSAPMRLAFLYEKPQQHPAWNMDWDDRQKPPTGYVDGSAHVSIVENGPARVALQVERTARGSTFKQIVRLSAGSAGERVEFMTKVDWRTSESSLKAVFPLTISNGQATYNEGVGTVNRGNNDPKKYEVPAQEWFDLTGVRGDYGVSVLNEAKYGSDKPNDNTLRLTLLYTPGVRGRFQYQATQDWGHHEIQYALQGHAGDWRAARTADHAARLNQPLQAFQTTAHGGTRGRGFSLLDLSGAPGVSVAAVKKAEASDEIVVRLFEQYGNGASNVRLCMATPIVSAREIDGQERPIAPKGSAALKNGALVFDIKPYNPRAFALGLKTIPPAPARQRDIPLRLPLNLRVARFGESDRGGGFDVEGRAYPGERLAQTIQSAGVTFRLGRQGDANALSCAGQTLQLPSVAPKVQAKSQPQRWLYLLAAAQTDTRIALRFMDSKGGQMTSIPFTVQAWNGYIGQWDKRLWEGKIPEKDPAVWPNAFAGLNPGYIKCAPIAWYADHTRLASGQNDPYRFCYLFRYAVPVPAGAERLILPRDLRVRVFGATVSTQAADLRPAQPMYDVLPAGSPPK